ncbi:hypothetical protein D3C77_392210 [compost metagenome]
MTKMPRSGATAQQAVHGRDIGRDVFPHLGVNRQTLDLLANRLGQARRRLACRCCQPYAQWSPGLYRRRLKQGQQTHDSGGLTGTRTAGDDAEATACGQGAGQLLPVHLPCLTARGK